MRKINMTTLWKKTLLYRVIIIIIQVVYTYLFIRNWERSFQISWSWNIVNLFLFFIYSYYFDRKDSPYVETKGKCILLTGLSGSGKSTIANRLKERLEKEGKKVQIIDGDVVRSTINKDLGFSLEDRRKNIERAAYLAKFLVKQNVIVLFSFICPTNEMQELVKSVTGECKIVHVSCPLEVCEDRDVKGLYKKVRTGEIKQFTGISSPYEAPVYPDCVCNTDKEKLEESVTKILDETC